MKLSAAQRRQLRMALASAVEWERTLAESHYVAYPKRYTGVEPKIVPAEYRPIVARCKRRIANYRRLYEILK